ncbi:hypothetical protein HQ535_09610 [bacterium]|nr:hypothetical protein [bacterium]
MPVIQYAGKNDGRGPSPAIWSKINTALMDEDPNHGIHFFDDFENFGDNTENDATARYHSQIDAGGTIVQTDSVDGRIQLLTDAGADDGLVMGLAANLSGFANIVENSNRKVAFEGRVLFGEAILGQSFFLGLIEMGKIVADTILVDAGGAVDDENYVGFNVLEADPNGISAVHRGGDTAEVVIKEEAQVITAATNYKLGLFFDGRKTITFYVDGESVGTAQTDDTDFPDDTVLGPVIAYKEHSGSAEYVEMDWWRAAYQGTGW